MAGFVPLFFGLAAALAVIGVIAFGRGEVGVVVREPDLAAPERTKVEYLWVIES